MQSFLGACGMRIGFEATPADLARRAVGLDSLAPPKSQNARIAAVAGVVVMIGLLLASFVWFFKK
jgi:hypothetical protein